MKFFRPFYFFLLLFFLIPNGKIFSWGFWAHKKINRMAVFTLPSEMIPFYKKNIEFISEHAADPDRRRNAVAGEAARHYFDTEHYHDSVPLLWNDAVAKYGEDSLNDDGIVPWYMVKMMYMLTDAFQKKDVYHILRYSAELGHYVADAHVPLHTTENYNGQLTGQQGIHGFWESRLPELYGDSYNYFTGKAMYIEHPQEEAWKIVHESFAEVDSVLRLEKILTETYPSDKKFSYEQKGSVTVKVYSKEFSEKYHEMLHGMVENRMRLAIQRVGSFWYTAWINAGSPPLDPELTLEIYQKMQDSVKHEMRSWQGVKLKTKGHVD